MLSRIVAGAVLVLALAAPSAPAQQADAGLRQAAEKLSADWADALNRGDAKAAAGFFAADGVEINVYGKQTGHEIEEEVQRVHQMGVRLKTTVDEVRPLAAGEMMLVTGRFEVAYSNNPTTTTAAGNWLRLCEKQGSEWKILAQTLTRQAPPIAATGSSTAPQK